MFLKKCFISKETLSKNPIPVILFYIVVIHAENAKDHANTAKTDKNINIDNQKIDMGIVYLDQAITYGEKGQTEAAKNAAADALINFLNASKNQFQ